MKHAKCGGTLIKKSTGKEVTLTACDKCGREFELHNEVAKLVFPVT